ncbi:LSM domain-containing protein [Encephalitozoon hellem]|uniref:LSM complex subunit LSM4 n=1 Tax=Encephalitozoon hellem TaxID=27973 RepID=A0A9Q9F945_ENCHE|nr:U6 snRNA associated Sm-like protein [Encephalitozoon hellem ATCC 50504]AFM97924.1 U6 snRNA associated Sm-like protein [Encephalitozoon hellem ATCC 50504]KAG5859295.1 LSM domain-containing protein [Encephalitozoon hellem]UTX42727.1 small nuclear ribonucleoprotein SmD1 [Encephalitozoon hellem]WEL38186.1 small nuclear ribonucleoprotein SmD1 [Encephalitozoon hellem]|eukprot:XP_003886905.1 U6 snRNA associated Sm-like protein [Encephalitozoon hellem ATCC 50504]
MYPLTLLRISRNKIVELELKNNDQLRGLLYKCDMAMNLHLKSATIQKEDGTSVFINECYLKGTSIKLVKLESKILLEQKEEDVSNKA